MINERASGDSSIEPKVLGDDKNKRSRRKKKIIPKIQELFEGIFLTFVIQ